MPSKEFGLRLRELRRKAGLSQRELARRVGVNYSYLSKIESQAMPPPREQIVNRLAEVLDADREELLLLAGKIPGDVAQLLKNRSLVRILRSGKTLKSIGSTGRKEGIQRMKKVFKGSNLARIALPVVLVLAVAASIYYAAPMPASALQINYPSVPSSGTIGTSYTFSVKVSVEQINDVLPVNSIDLVIRNKSNPSTYKATVTGMPIPGTGLTSSSKSFTSSQTGGGAVSATASTTYGWTWALGGSGRQGYGYRDPDGLGYHTFGSSFGYGYAYNSNQGNTSITFSVTWTVPSSFPGGTYEIITYVYGDAAKTKKWSGTSSTFSLQVLSTPSPGPGPIQINNGIVDVSRVITYTGLFIQDVNVLSPGAEVSISVDRGTIGKTKDSLPLSRISVLPVASPRTPPADKKIIGLPFDLGPSGATFNPPATLTFKYDPANVPSGTDPKELKIAYYDEATQQWIVLTGEAVNTVTKTITVKVSHFTEFAVMVTGITPPPPPSEPTEPEQPTQPPAPEQPAQPTQPEQPAQPTAPEQPAQPSQPTQPTTPAQPIQPTEPEQPAAPAGGGIAWWIWVIIGVIVVGAAAALYFSWWRRRI